MELFFHYLSQPYLLTGIFYTLLITAIGLGGGLVMGTVLAGMQLSRLQVLSLITRAYAIIFRGTPLILQMIFCYNALPMIGVKLTAVEAGGLALALNEGVSLPRSFVETSSGSIEARSSPDRRLV
jgi:polar amino acid transport system permease protein